MSSTTNLVPKRHNKHRRQLKRESIETLLASIITLGLQIYIYISSLYSEFEYPIELLILGCLSGVFGVFTGICGIGAAANKAATLIPCIISAILASGLNGVDTYFTIYEVYDMTSEVANITTTTIAVEAAIGGTTLLTAIGSFLIILTSLVVSCQKKHRPEESVDSVAMAAPSNIVETQQHQQQPASQGAYYIDGFREIPLSDSSHMQDNQPRPYYVDEQRWQPAPIPTSYINRNPMVPQLHRDQVQPYGQMSANVDDYQRSNRGRLAQLHNQRQATAKF